MPNSKCLTFYLFQVVPKSVSSLHQQLALAVALSVVPTGTTKDPHQAAWHFLHALKALPNALDNDVCGSDERCQSCNVQLKIVVGRQTPLHLLP